jgi:predicted metal-dependent hydrolase
VAQSLSMDQLQKLAAYGARARVEELRAEIAAITEAFPGRAAISAAQKKRWAAIRKKRGAGES